MFIKEFINNLKNNYLKKFNKVMANIKIIKMDITVELLAWPDATDFNNY